ncbi:MAG: transglutaminase-like domain-containing protein [Candidatus Woesearchaeota archaeon]
MIKVFNDDTNGYLVLPKKRALVYVELGNNNSLKLLDKAPYTINMLATDEIKYDSLSNSYIGPGRIVLSISTNVYRGMKDSINPNIVSINSTGLENYLGKSPNINPDAKSISELAKNIQNQLPKENRNNPYFLTNEIANWINANIEYLTVPKSTIKKVENVISKMPFENRINSYEILKNSFNIGEKSLREIVSQINLKNSLKEHATNYQIAKTILDQVGDKWEFFQELWYNNNGLSAEKTLQESSGKCVGITNLYVALSRNLGIPSAKVLGYVSDNYGLNQGGHAWAVSYISPYGWIDVDPSPNSSNNFNYANYAYQFSKITSTDIKFTLVNTDPEVNSRVSSKKIDDMISLLEKNNPNDNLSGNEKYQKEIKSLRLLQKLYSGLII